MENLWIRTKIDISAVLRACAVLTQLIIENGVPLFEVGNED